MPPAKTPKIKPAQLRAAFKNDLATCWKLSRSLHSGFTPYAFVLYGVEGSAQFMPQVLTEESLTQVAQRYLKDGYYETLEEARKGLRYSVADSPLLAELEDKLATVDALLKPHENFLIEEETSAYKWLVKAAMEALAELDKEELFGKGKEREQLLLVIITEDTEKDWSKPSAKKLNPPTVFKRFEAETRVEGSFAVCDALAFSPDEQSVYATGSREIDSKKNKSESEFIAFDRVGFGLKRRWKFSFPRFGDSGVAVSCSRDGKTILLARRKYENNVGQTYLMRFGCDTNKVLAQTKVPGGTAGFAMSHDETCMAVTTHDKSLHILDGNLNLLQTVKLETKAYGAQFLRSGELLLATDAGVLRADKNFKISPAAHSKPAFALSVDDLEEKLVVSSWAFQVDVSQRAQPFGIQILKLPTFELIREITNPGEQAVTAVLSPDGRLVAFEANTLKGYRQYIVVCETKTGREIARRKSDTVHDLIFLGDNRTLVIGHSGFTATEPILFWRVPGI